jgi:hypothetical protein
MVAPAVAGLQVRLMCGQQTPAASLSSCRPGWTTESDRRDVHAQASEASTPLPPVEAPRHAIDLAVRWRCGRGGTAKPIESSGSYPSIAATRVGTGVARCWTGAAGSVGSLPCCLVTLLTQARFAAQFETRSPSVEHSPHRSGCQEFRRGENSCRGSAIRVRREGLPC